MALQQTKPKKSTARRKRQRAPEWGSHSPTFKSRLKAAGLDNDTPPEDIDEFRNLLTRRIYIILNRWRGCSQPLCRRYRGCMAPHIVCSNAGPPPPVSDEEFARFKARFHRALREAADRRDAEGR